jgi:hypothetical protein
LKSLGLVEKNDSWRLTTTGAREAGETVLPDKDITSQVRIHSYDEEVATLTRCICGETFEPWDFSLGIYKDDPKECPNCHRRMYCSISVKVYEVEQ